jgi:8-oxo-dGTP pyrophosphatase MutT (NUDIX family)
VKQAAVVLIIKDNLILGVSRKDNPDKFGLIGGKREPWETLAQTAYREVKEETGILIKACQPIYHRTELKSTPDGEDFEAWCYYATLWDGEPVSKEGTKVEWLTEEELTKTKAAFPDYNLNTLAAFKKAHPGILPGLVIPAGACGRCNEKHEGLCWDRYPVSRMPTETK